MQKAKDPYRLPDEAPMIAHVLFWLTWFGGMALLVIFVLPLVYQYVSLPFGDWVYELARSWTGEPYKPR